MKKQVENLSCFRLAYKFMISAIILISMNASVFAQTYPPSCVVTSPHSNSYFQQNSDVVINVYSTDKGKTQKNGSVTKVEFYIDGNKIGETSSQINNTYSFTWKCAQVGEYRLTAKSTNDKGVSFTSVGQFVTVGSGAVSPKGISANKGKYLANIIGGSANVNYNEYWNGVTAENACKWGSVEGTRDVFKWSGADVTYNHAKNNNMMFRYHALVWGNQTPSWLSGIQNDVPAFKAELEEYIVAVAERYKYMDQVDVLNEEIGTHAPNTQWFRNGLGGGGATGYDWAVYLFERARELLPNTKLVINDYSLVGSSTNINAQLKLMSHLRDRGLIDGFGTQSHDFSVDRVAASTLKSNLDQMANGGVPIFVTELDLRGGVDSDNNDAQQLESYKTHFPVYWEHPHVAGITLWGYVTGRTWRTGTGIMNSSGDPKSAFTWMKNYITSQTDIKYPFGTIPGSCCATPPPTVAISSYIYEVGDIASQLSATGNLLTWYSPDGSMSTVAPKPSTDVVGTFTYSVTQTGSCESSRTSISVIVYEPQAPYGGIAHVIPGKIEIEEYDLGGPDTAYYDTSIGNAANGTCRSGDNVDLEECTDIGGGCNLGWSVSGEWLEYTVNVQASGTYSIALRAATSGAGKTVSLTSNGTAIATDVVISDTEGWQAWETVTIKGVQLNAGEQVIRLTIGATDYVNLNYMTFTPESVVTPPTIDISSPIDNSIYNSNEKVTITATAGATDATVTNVKFYAGTQLLSTDNTSPYTYDWSGMSAGDYLIKAVVTDSNNSEAFDEVTITVTDAANTVRLKEGWNLIGCPIAGSTAIDKALSSVLSELIVVKDQQGFWNADQSQYLNSLNNLDWGKGYFVKVSSDCDLDWNVK